MLYRVCKYANISVHYYKQTGSIGAFLYVAGRTFSTLCCSSLFTHLHWDKGSGEADKLTTILRRDHFVLEEAAALWGVLTTSFWIKQDLNRSCVLGKGLLDMLEALMQREFMAVSSIVLLWTFCNCLEEKTYHGFAKHSLPFRRGYVEPRWLSRIF